MDTTISDHGIVITTIAINRFYRNAARTAKPEKEPTLDVHQLHMDPVIKEHYLQTLQNSLTDSPIPAEIPPEEQCEQLKHNMLEAAHLTIPPKVTRHSNQIHHTINKDNYLKKTRAHMNQISFRLYRSSRRHEIPANTRRRLKLQINHLRYQTKARQRHLYDTHLNKLASSLDSQSFDPKNMFNLMRKLQIKTYQPFRLQDQHGNYLMTPISQADALLTYYTAACNNPAHTPVPPWDQPNNPRPLQNPITIEETTEAILQLRNGKAPGTNKLPGELLKYSQDITSPFICNALNSIFTTHQPIPEINTGRFVFLNKPNKTPTIPNTRPLTVLNDIRKVYSNIVKNRVQDKLLNYISNTQAAYRPKRSTSI